MYTFKKKRLSQILSKIAPNPQPRLRWESYALDANSAAKIAYTAQFINGDVLNKKVVDLGCGSGILAISASLLNAEWVVGVDIDKEAIRTAKMNAKNIGVEVDFIIGDIGCMYKGFDTTIMNPPFGSWKKGTDIRFLKRALEISEVVYSLHKSSSLVRRFLNRRIPEMNGRIDQIYELKLNIPRTYVFHRRKKYEVEANLYRIVKRNQPIAH